MDECKRIYCRLNGVRIMKSSNEQINCLLEGGVCENGVCRISGESIKRREQIEEMTWIFLNYVFWSEIPHING